MPAPDPLAECRRRTSSCRRKRFAPARTKPQTLPISTFAGRALNTAPFDQVLELSFPSLSGPVRATEYSSAIKDLLPLCSNNLDGAAIPWTPDGSATTTGKTQLPAAFPGL